METDSNHEKMLNNQDKMKLQKEFADYNFFFRLSHFILKYRLYRGFDGLPFLGLRMIAIVLGKINAKKVYKKLHTIWQILYPDAFLKKINTNKWADCFITFNIELFFIISFILPLHSYKNIETYAPLQGIEHLENALKRGKGALITTTHLGQSVNPISTLLHHKIYINDKEEKIFVVILTSRSKEFVFREISKKWDNIDVVISGKFDTLQDIIKNHLEQNHCVLFMQDFYHKSQLRVPFIYRSKKYNFLVPCPQMVSSFHFNHGSPVLPMLSFPTDDIRKTKLIILEEMDLMKLDPNEEESLIKDELLKFQSGKLTKKAKYGLLSLKINEFLNPLILKFPFYWEELYSFKKKSSFRINFKEVNSYYKFLELTIEQLKKFIENSYEPGRDDQKIITVLEDIKKEMKTLIREKEEDFHIHNKFIEIGNLNTFQAIKKVVSIALAYQTIFIKENYSNIENLLKKLILYSK